MTDKSILETIKAAADQLVAADDSLLRAIAAIAAHSRVQIVPVKPDFLGADARPMIVLPERMYDRMLAIIPEARRG